MPDNPFENLRQPARENNLPAVREERLPAVREENELVNEVEIYRDLTPEQVDKLNAWVVRQDMGLSIGSGPLICREGCPHQEVCPLYQDNIHPLGKQCPVEASLIMRWKRRWAADIGIDLDDEVGGAFDLKLLDDLATISVLKRRAMIEMATEAPDIAETVVGGYVNDQPIEKIYLNPRVQLIERLGKLELKMYNELLSTRKSKFQVAGRIDDLSKRQAEMAKKMREVREREEALAREQEAETIDAEFDVKEE